MSNKKRRFGITTMMAALLLLTGLLTFSTHPAKAVLAKGIAASQQETEKIYDTKEVTKLPKILYRENARYTKEARDNQVSGIVRLNVVFRANGKLTDINVERGLPDGLTEQAIEAVQKTRFEPAQKDGQPVSVRGKIEISFSLS